MQRNTPLRDPFATEEDESTYSGVGRVPPRLPSSGQAPPQRNPTELATSSLRPLPSRDTVPGPSRLNASLSAPRSSVSRPSTNNAGSAGASAAPRSLGLSLGLPRSRIAARDNRHDEAHNTSTSVPGAASQTDQAVRNTDSDALLSRLSALKLGYLPPEPYTQEFSTSSQLSHEQAANKQSLEGSAFSRPHQPNPPARRSPLINIGTYLRCTTIDNEVEAFLKQGDTQKQIISIGAGSDSRYWRIMSDPVLSKHLSHYLEVDFDENTSSKLSRILRSSTLRSSLDSDSLVHGIRLSDLSPNPTAQQYEQDRPKRTQVLRSSKYTLLEADLRSIHPDTASEQRIDPDLLFGSANTALRPELPTLVLFECVLAYITPDKADWLIELLGRKFADISAVSYDIALSGDTDNEPSTAQETASASRPAQPAVPPSRFGRVMLQNLEMRKLSLPGAKAYPTIKTQSERFNRAWSSPSGPTSSASDARQSSETQSQVEASGRSLFSIWSALDTEQKNRLSRLEGLDEVEEIDMLLKHYCIVQARRKP